MNAEPIHHFNNASHALRDGFNHHADALIQWHRDEIVRLTAAKVDLRKVLDPVIGIPEHKSHQGEDVEATAKAEARLADASRGDEIDETKRLALLLAPQTEREAA